MEDVACGDAAFGEAARNQETTMTIERFALGAHQTDARSPRVVEEPVKTSDVPGFSRHGFVVGDTVAIEPVVAVATAENVAQCRVTDAGGGERRRQRLLRKTMDRSATAACCARRRPYRLRRLAEAPKSALPRCSSDRW